MDHQIGSLYISIDIILYWHTNGVNCNIFYYTGIHYTILAIKPWQSNTSMVLITYIPRYSPALPPQDVVRRFNAEERRRSGGILEVLKKMTHRLMGRFVGYMDIYKDIYI